jgi:hypothetical protein
MYGGRKMDKDTAVSDYIEQTDTQYIISGNTTVEVVAHFTKGKTYEDIVKDALQREFSEFAE